eukprot:c10932_g1_i2.p2 GENE.c10932_g1_i2~~c10932_g1_i2.p2  ORF type:complete len:168 (+),score=55.09 c10932_g1_i2:914-1417(+)
MSRLMNDTQVRAWLEGEDGNHPGDSPPNEPEASNNQSKAKTGSHPEGPPTDVNPIEKPNGEDEANSEQKGGANDEEDGDYCPVDEEEPQEGDQQSGSAEGDGSDEEDSEADSNSSGDSFDEEVLASDAFGVGKRAKKVNYIELLGKLQGKSDELFTEAGDDSDFDAR